MEIAFKSDIFGKDGNGTLDATICYEVGNWNHGKGDKHLNVSLTDDNVLAIHSITFQITFGKLPVIENFWIKDWNKVRGEISVKFPLLDRIYDMYADAIYQKEEVKSLLDECNRLELNSENKASDLALSNKVKINYPT